MSSKETKVGIVIPVHNCLEYTMMMLRSIKTAHPYQIIVVDDHSDAPMKDWLNSRQDILCISDPHGSTGLAFNWNLGIKTALREDCSHVLVVNNDIVLHPAAIDNLVLRIDRGDALLVTGFHIGQHYATLADLPDFDLDAEGEDSRPDFSCFMVTERTLETAGWFDENYRGAYYEDIDYHATVISRRATAIQSPSAPMYHFGSRTLADNPEIGPRIGNAAAENCAYFIGKWNRHPFTLLSDKARFFQEYSARVNNLELQVEQFKLESALLDTVHDYYCIGWDRRDVTFLPSHFLGLGATPTERYWSVWYDEGDWVLEISQYEGVTCTLRADGNGSWGGRSVDGTRQVVVTPNPS